MLNSWENPMKSACLQPLVMVAKGKVSFATMTDACKEATFMDFYLWKNILTSEDKNLPMNLATKKTIFFSFFKENSQNRKFKF